MAEALPVRLQLSRRRGFDLQAASRALNGLPAVNVARPTKWGNPVRVGQIDNITRAPIDAELAVEKFTRRLLLGMLDVSLDDIRRELFGKNLACWCKPGAPCHADVLIELAKPDGAAKRRPARPVIATTTGAARRVTGGADNE